jgi:hypothetical protein
MQTPNTRKNALQCGATVLLTPRMAMAGEGGGDQLDSEESRPPYLTATVKLKIPQTKHKGISSHGTILLLLIEGISSARPISRIAVIATRESHEHRHIRPVPTRIAHADQRTNIRKR